MNKREQIASAQVGAATLVRLPYLGNASMVLVFATDKNDDLDAVLKQLSPADINNVKFNTYDTMLSVPKFKLEVEYDLLKDLRPLGLTKLNELDNLAENGGRLAVDQAIHKAVVNVDEKGTTAAAVTVIVVTRGFSSPQREFVLDRPFAFVIKDDFSDLHLFTGRVNQL